MTDWLKNALTRKISIKTSQKRKPKIIIVEPSERLVYGVKFTIIMTLCLTALQIAHMALLGRWNSEIFAAITGLTGTVSGVLIGQRA